MPVEFSPLEGEGGREAIIYRDEDNGNAWSIGSSWNARKKRVRFVAALTPRSASGTHRNHTSLSQ